MATPPAKIRIGELARLAGTSRDTLRHYERVGVLAPAARSANGYRSYPATALRRVRLVKRALAVGFTLPELASILAERDRGGAPCREVRALAERKLAALEVWLGELTTVRTRLRALLADWDGKLAATPAGRRAGLLDALAADGDTTPEEVAARPPLRPRAARRRA